MAEIFRFVTVRNPRKPNDDEISTGFVKYDPKLEAPLIKQVAAAGKGPSPVSAMRAAIQRFKGSLGYVSSTEQLEAKAPGLLAWADWVAARSDRLTVDQLDEFLAGHPLNIEDQVHRLLWDNLLAYTYAGGPSEVREAIIWSLRVTKLLAWEEDRDDALVQRIASATVLLPADVQIPIEHSHPDQEPNASGPSEEEKQIAAA